MVIDPEITWRGMKKRSDLDRHIRLKAAKLDRYHDRIISCRVAVEKEQKEQHAGGSFRIRVIVRVPPGKEMIGRYESGELESNFHPEVAVKEAFDAIRRQLLKVKNKQQGETKSHPMQEELVGHVITLFRDKAYGFIRTREGREMFFHKNAVLNDDFDRLDIGTGVRYFPSEGEKGPQASTVQIIDKPGIRSPATRPASV
jgi:cold shock CspA family protein